MGTIIDLNNTPAQIHSIFGPTVYKGTVSDLIENLLWLNGTNAGLYRLRITIKGREVDLVPLHAVRGYDLNNGGLISQSRP